jgi:hypothetical protein
MAFYFTDMALDFNTDKGYVKLTTSKKDAVRSERFADDSVPTEYVLDRDAEDRLVGIEISRIDLLLSKKYAKNAGLMNVVSRVPLFVHEKDNYALLLFDDKNAPERGFRHSFLEIKYDHAGNLISIRIEDIRSKLQKTFMK